MDQFCFESHYQPSGPNDPQYYHFDHLGNLENFASWDESPICKAEPKEEIVTATLNDLEKSFCYWVFQEFFNFYNYVETIHALRLLLHAGVPLIKQFLVSDQGQLLSIWQIWQENQTPRFRKRIANPRLFWEAQLSARSSSCFDEWMSYFSRISTMSGCTRSTPTVL